MVEALEKDRDRKERGEGLGVGRGEVTRMCRVTVPLHITVDQGRTDIKLGS